MVVSRRFESFGQCKKGYSSKDIAFQEAKERAGKLPKVIISNGAQNFDIAIVEEFPNTKT